MDTIIELLINLGAAAIGAIIIGAFWRFRARVKECLASREFNKTFRAGRTCVVTSKSNEANWDFESRLQCRERLERARIQPLMIAQDSLDMLWANLQRPQEVNLIVLGSPIRLQLASDFLTHLANNNSLPASLCFVKSATMCNDPYVRPLAELARRTPGPGASGNVNPSQISQTGGGQSLVWPGILLRVMEVGDDGEEHERESIFPKYPREGDLRPATYRGFEHGIVLVYRDTVKGMSQQPRRLEIVRLVMLMGYSGPSTLATTVAYLTRPDLFEPEKGGVLLSVLEVPVVCSSESIDRDLRFVPENSTRIVYRGHLFHKAARHISLPHALPHEQLELSVNLQRSPVGKDSMAR